MRVESVSVNNLFVANSKLQIPYFQRAYKWEEKNWEQFFNDIAAIAAVEDENEREVYFLGSVILRDAGIKNSHHIYDVVDGQQRLTTIVIFMKALYLSMDRNNLFVKSFMEEDLDGGNNPILVPNHNDQPTYTAITELEVLKRDLINDTRMAQAFKYFGDRIMNALHPEEGPAVTPRMLYDAIINWVRLVSIEVNDGENPQKIFQTINCEGTPLTTGELLKNYLFDRTNVDYYDRSWKQVFEQGNSLEYWEEEIVKGRIKSIHLENFFYRYMLIKMQQPEIKANLSAADIKEFRKKEGSFKHFCKLIEKNHLDRNAVIDEIVKYAKIYMSTFKAEVLKEALVDYSGIVRLSALMFMQDSWTMTPYILYIMTTVENEMERERIFSYMETYLLRRIICKCKNNNYSDMFSENLIGQGVNTAEAFIEYVNDAEARGALLMPSDEDVKDALLNNDLKMTASTILYMLESKLNHNFTQDDNTNGYLDFTIEQIMTEVETEAWPLAAGCTPDQRKASARTLGNFILLREPLKAKDKKADWRNKKLAMSTKVKGLETSVVATRDLAEWNMASIESKNKWLASKIIELWAI